MLGDQLNSRHNHSQVIKQFVNFIERFNGKELFIISGNHEKVGSGETAIDFLKEVKNPKWHIVTDEVYIHQENGKKYVFCPYFTNPELGVENSEEASKKLLKKIGTGDILFIHHGITNTGLFAPNELLLAKTDLRKKFKMVFGGHFHVPSEDNDIIVCGSVFTQEVGEQEKFIWGLDETSLEVKKFKLPNRPIYKQENPTIKGLDKLEKNSIVKVILTKKYEDDELEEIQDKLKEFDAHIIIEDIPTQRKKMIVGGVSNILDLSLDQLLEAYAKERNIEYSKLIMGFDLIR